MGAGASANPDAPPQEGSAGPRELAAMAKKSPTPSPPSSAGGSSRLPPIPSAASTVAADGGKAAPALAATPSGLAARRGVGGRQMKPLQVATRKPGDRRYSILDRVRNHGGDATEKKNLHIKWTDKFSLHYTIGAEVMPSGHRYMEVRHAMRLEDGERVVVKVRYKPRSFISKSEEAEWRTSMEFMLNLPKSGSIAQLYEVLEDESAYYVVMEKVEGMDLFETLDAEGRLPMYDCKDIIRKLLTAIAEMHDQGFIHKDLKLENIMIDRTPKVSSGPSGQFTPTPKRGNSVRFSQGAVEVCSPTVVKLIDFDTVEAYSPKTPGGSRKKSIVGTDQYIAPEAYAGNYSLASDVFAIGVIAYKLITGRFPYRNDMFDDQPGENYVGSPKMKEIQEKLKAFTVDFGIEPFPKEPMASEIVRGMLNVVEGDRPTARQALAHPFFADGRSNASSPTSASFAAAP